ncbi:MAG: hypothetical protein K1X28_03825 [Parachlamydiales bacterium]|nr:hypothetical protein [Parachlamydiales bacterium]
MANIFSVESLAARHVESTLRGDVTEQARRKCAFDFKITGFNASTVATIAMVAAAIFTGSILVYALALLAYQVRGAFMRSILTTGLEEGGDLIARINELNPNDAKAEIAEHLGIEDEEWQMTHSQILAFKLWMNWTPAQRVVQPAVQQQQAHHEAVAQQ